MSKSSVFHEYSKREGGCWVDSVWLSTGCPCIIAGEDYSEYKMSFHNCKVTELLRKTNTSLISLVKIGFNFIKNCDNLQKFTSFRALDWLTKWLDDLKYFWTSFILVLIYDNDPWPVILSFQWLVKCSKVWELLPFQTEMKFV